MKNNELIPIQEQLDRIEKKLNGKYSDPFLSLKQVSELTSLSTSTLRRSIRKGCLKCSKNSGKLLFKRSNVERWLNG